MLMTDELKEKLADAASKLIDKVEEGGDFILDQMPLIAQELVAYERAYRTAWVCIAVVWVILYAFLILPKGIKLAQGKIEEVRTNVGMGMCVMGGCVSVMALFGFFININPMMKAWFAPRLVILDYLKEML
jgi:hypothetical protein